MSNCWNWFLGVALWSLLFIAIPITFSSGNSKEKLQLMFNDYIEKFNKTYKDDPVEYEERFKHFVDSVKEIQLLNAEARGPQEHRARYGLTKLSDMSKEEYREIHLSDEVMKHPPHHYNRTWSGRRDGKQHHILKSSSEDDSKVYSRKRRATLPLQVDWRVKKVIGKIRNQGLCGACWAFSTVGAMEAMAAINTGVLEPLSVQEVIDCATLGNSGCAGGDICLLLNWLTISKAPVEKESDYPLRLVDGACKLKKNSTGVMLKSFTCDDFRGKEDKILEAIATHGPVAVAVNALTWQNYLGGVVQYNCPGTPSDLNHAVELVGYDLTALVPHYIAKNSWGAEFGNSGYIHLAVGGNMCGLANEVATVDVGIAPTVVV